VSHDQQVTKIVIPKECKDIVIFVHGFGVRYDSRGLFKDLIGGLQKNWGYAMFDLYSIDEGAVYVSSIYEQTKRLAEVVENIKDSYEGATIHLIAHSKGCIITSLLKPRVSGKVIFLAPPENFGTELEEYFMRYPGSQKTKTELIIPRKDSTITHIPLTYFKESRKIDAQQSMDTFAQNTTVYIIQATTDEVLGRTTYSELKNNPNIQIIPISGDHNFSGEKRVDLINTIMDIL